jgi:hypothetical protein
MVPPSHPTTRTLVTGSAIDSPHHQLWRFPDPQHAKVVIAAPNDRHSSGETTRTESKRQLTTQDSGS